MTLTDQQTTEPAPAGYSSPSTVADDALDPITYEILRHRLASINDEAATTIARVSGSPVANESYDFNAALLTADGDVVVIGNYVMAHAAALDCVVRYVIDEYSDNPGYGEGDMFMTNDPYVGAMHQPDVVLVAPIHVDGELIAWCGSIVHQTDVGGPVAGSVTTGATSIYEEAIPLAPIRIVEGGRVRRDIEREYLIRSRMPQLNALDMRGQIASNKVQAERIGELCAQYGTPAVTGCMERLIAATAVQFERRLAQLPDGRWRHTTFIEHDGLSDAVYEVTLTLTKTGTKMDLDLTESSPQAASLINCSVGTVRGYSLASVLTLLAYDMPWVPAALWKSITIRSRPGTIVDAEWPAGVSMGNTSVGHALRTAVNICISLMLDASEELAHESMASCLALFGGQNISGVRPDGRRFGTMLLDSLGGGGGAKSFGDGVNTAGMINAPASAIGNVEVNELNYPLLYLWRRELTDSGGPGRYRGGVGGQHAYVPYGMDDPIGTTLFASGIEQPASAGLAGGDPGDPNGFRIGRGRGDDTTTGADLLDAEAPEAKTTTTIGVQDVFLHQYSGGGGFGDPIERTPEEVLEDVQVELVSPRRAELDYFVAIRCDDAGEMQVDAAATEELRAQERRRRLGGATPLPASGGVAAGRRLSSALNVSDGQYVCRRCDHEIGATDRNVRELLTVDELAVVDRWPETAAYPGARRFVLRHYHCPSCAARSDVELALAGAEPVAALEVI